LAEKIVKPIARKRETPTPVKIFLAGPFAWFGGESGQVGNEAAIVVQSQCRSKARLFIFCHRASPFNRVHFLFTQRVFGFFA